MPTTDFYPGLRQRDRSPAVGDGHQQQLMSKAHLAAIHDQEYFGLGHLLDDGPGDRLIPLSHSDCRVGQQPLDAPCFAGQTSQTPGTFPAISSRPCLIASNAPAINNATNITAFPLIKERTA